MNDTTLTDSEFLILGLVAEMPRHGYELEQVIERRQMREWTQIGFSSIYYVLGKLEKRGYIAAGEQASAKAKKEYAITDSGLQILVQRTATALAEVRPSYPAVLLGMLHWDVLTRDQALSGLKSRLEGISKKLERINEIRFEQQPIPDFVDAVFEYSARQLEAERIWIRNTYDYMRAKPGLPQTKGENE
ncbi:PadR family transcriptional regulator [Sediminispirochaeta bajacaliforniensis]|uniref:PadR family transcriptional regulator n=1 Tax=Sediminispirochaeta bajacaliforniensis TaxID=148 RepID=UPI00036B1AEB|nr:PadR family transcriptional regulator [Sediminispirochaeta bajacaliforniensis]